MKRTVIVLVGLASTILGGSVASAAVNCDQVMKYLKTGRTPEDIADTMVVPVDEVKKCQAAGDSKGAAAAPGADAAKSGAPSAAPDASKKH
jgi:hypothetical protein